MLHQDLGETFNRYTCNSSICFGNDGGTTHALFKEIQFQINRAGAKMYPGAWKNIGVDGFIGAGTVAGYKLVALFAPDLVKGGRLQPKSFTELASWVRDEHPKILNALTTLGDNATGKEENLQAITARIDAAKQDKGTVSSAASSSSGRTVLPEQTFTFFPPGSSAGPASRRPLYLAAGLGLATLAIIGTAVAVAHHKRR